MTAVLDLLSWLLMMAGLLFFVTSALGLLRFPDIYTRLHAVTKADNVGLGLLVAGLMIQAGRLQTALLLLLIWLLVMAAAATSCQLLARYSLERDSSESNKSGAGSDDFGEDIADG